MKNAEDEAFDEIAKKQGAWGGGFKAKQAMAADKLQEPVAYMKEEWLFPNTAVPVDMQTTAALVAEIKRLIHVVGGMALEISKQHELAQPVQEPVACVMGTYGGMFVVAPLNPAAILPVGMAFYAAPVLSGRKWNFCERCGKRTKDLTTIHTCTPPQGVT